uniref:ZU5 domain-containing protein n=1 Tax=Eptatretus burgeri TaxID=7764 RepID=A0A8C4RAC8_EPTBU
MGNAPLCSRGKDRFKEQESGGTAGLLRAARAGNVEKVLELLNQGGDVNTRNEAGLTALHLAAKEGHAGIVSELLQRDADVAAATKKGNQALHVACLAGEVDVARVLIRRGADVNAQAQHGFTPLYMASQENHVEVLRLLLENGADQTIPTEDGFTPLAVALQQGHEPAVATLLESDIRRPGSREGQGGEGNKPPPPRTRLPALHAAARKGDTQSVGIILDGGVQGVTEVSKERINNTTESGFTALHIAAHYGSQDVAVLLLDRGADCNFKANNGITPLHVAAKRGHTELVTTILDHGATIDAGTRDGLTPLHCAARSGHESTVRLLIERGTPILAQTKNGLSPLHMASQGDHPPTMRTLLAGGSPVDPVTLDLLTPLHVAAHCGHHRAARVLLEGGSDPNAKALNGFTPLHVACKKVRRRVIQLLLRFGASLQATTRSGLTPLHVAAFMGNADVETLLMQNGAQPNATNTRGETPLHVAAREGHVQAAKELLQGGAETDACTQDGETPLHVAAREDQEKVVDKLIENGAPLNIKNKNGFTPLHIAAQHGSKGAAKVLSDSKVLIDPQGKHDLTPLHVAVHYGHPDVALLLLERGASPHCITKSGHTALHIAAQCGPGQRYSSPEGGPVVASLLSRGADREARTRGGVTPLHLASLRGHLGVVSALLHAGAAPGPTTQAGLTPLHLAAQEDHVEVAAALLTHGAALEPKTQLGYTPLHIASHYGNIRMVAFLLQHGVDVDAKNKDGYTALHQATQQGHGNIVNLLLQHEAKPNERCSDGSRPLDVARSLGYISLEDTLQRVTDEPATLFKETGADKHKLNIPETMTEFPEVSDDEGQHPPRESTTIPSLLVSTFDAEDVSGLEDDSSPLTEQLDQQSILGYVPGSTSYSTLYSSPYKSPLRISKDPPLPISESEVFYMPLVDAQEDDFVLTSPLSSGFLVSFVADARGGHARASRHPGLRLAVPPLACPAPTRLTCRLVRGSSSRPASIAEMPTLPEGEGVVSRLFDIGPAGGHFLRPVVLELPHCASLKDGSRELMILRGEEGGGWKEHLNDASDAEMDSILDALGLERNPMMGRVVRVAARTLPRYIAIVSRLAQEGGFVPPMGGKLLSSMEKSVSAEIPEGAVTKPVRLGLQVMPVSPELVRSLGGNDISFGPVVTLEPRRRKFHRPISLSLPLPLPPEGRGDTERRPPQKKDIHLLCSIAGGSMPAQWEDVTATTPLHMDDLKKQISFSSSISARFWPVLVSGPGDPLPLASRLYSQLLHVPYLARFVLHTRAQPSPSPRRGSGQGDGTAVQCVCRTEMTGRGPGAAELLSGLGDGGLTEMARSKEVEVYAGRAVGVHCRGNLAIVSAKVPPEFVFQPFQLNRLNFALRVRDSTQSSSGRLSFVQAPGETVCNLNIMLPPTGKVGGYQKKDLEPMETIEGIMQSLDQKLTSGLRAFEESWPETTDHTKPEDGTQTDDADPVSPVTSVQEAFVKYKLSLPVPAPQDMTNISAADIEMEQLDITDPQPKDEDIKAEDEAEMTKSQNEIAMLKFLMSPLFVKEGKLENVAKLEMKTTDFPEISLKKISTEQVPVTEAEISGTKEFRTEDSENKIFISNLFPESKASPKVTLEKTPLKGEVAPSHAPKQFIASTDSPKTSLLSDFTDIHPAEYVEKHKTYEKKALTTSQEKSQDESMIPQAVLSTTEPVYTDSYSEEIVRAEAIIQEGTPIVKEGIIRDRVRVTTQICKPGFTIQHSTITMEKVIGDQSTRKISTPSHGDTCESVSKGLIAAKPADIISETRMDLTNVFESQSPSLSTLESEQTTEIFSIPQPDLSSSEDDFVHRMPTEDSSLSEATVIELQMEGMHVPPELPIDESVETHLADIADAKCERETKKSTIKEQKTEQSIRTFDILQSSISTPTSPEKPATLQDVQAAKWMSEIPDVDIPLAERSDKFAEQDDTDKEVPFTALSDQKDDKIDSWKTTEEESFVTDLSKERKGFSVHDDPQSEEIMSQFTDGKTRPQPRQSLHSERYSPAEEKSEEDRTSSETSKVQEESDLEQYTALTSEQCDEVKMEKRYRVETVLTRTVTSHEHRTRQVHEDFSTKSSIPADDKTKSLSMMPSPHEILQEDEGTSRKGMLKAWTPEIEVANIRTLKSWKSLEREEFPEKRLADEKVCFAPSEKDSEEGKGQFKSDVDLKKLDIQVCDGSPKLEHSREPSMITEESRERKEEKEILEKKEDKVKGKEDMDVMEELESKKAEKKDYKDEEVCVEKEATREEEKEEKKGEVELQVKLKKTEKQKEKAEEEQKEKEIDYNEKRKEESENITEGWKEKDVKKDKEPLEDTMKESRPTIAEAHIPGDHKDTRDVSLEKEVAEELGARSTSSDEEELVTTRVIRRRVIIKGDDFEDMPGESVTEEQYTDEQGNVVTRKVTRKIIRRVMAPGGTEHKDVTMKGDEQQTNIEGTDSSLIQLGESRVVKRTVIKTKGRHLETTVSEIEDSREAEPRQEVSREELVGDMWGERREKKEGDPRLSEGLPTAKEDFETLLLFAGLPARLFQQDLHESQVHNSDGSVTTRTRFQKSKGFERMVSHTK